MAQHSLWTTDRPTGRTAWRLTIGVVLFGTAAAATAVESAPFSLAYVPRDAILVFAARPATLLQREALAPLRETIGQFGRDEFAKLDVSPTDVAEVLVVLLPGPRAEPAVAVILRTTSPAAAQKFIRGVAPDAQPQQFAGQTYQRDRTRACFFQPDAKTTVFAPHEPTLRRCLAAGAAGAATTNWAARWGTVATEDAAAVVNTSLLRTADFSREVQALAGVNDNRSSMAAWQLAPLWQRSEHVVASLQVSTEIALRVVCQSASDDEARQVHSALLTAVSSLRTLVSRGRAEIAAQENAQSPLLFRSLDLVDEILEKAQVVRREQQVGVVARINAENTRFLTKLMPPAAAAAQQAGSRTKSMNHLKMIALAMHNYHDVYKRFPAAVQLGPKNTPRSWRVTILPFVEQRNLYDQYRQDEPWDSASNKRILATVPDLYRCPLDQRGSTNTAYFALTGRDTPFPENQNGRMADILDGTSNTLMVVESKQATPWTKPEDIPFDAEKPLPKLGGWYPDGFCTAFCDGSVRFLSPDKIEERTLRFLIMRADGNAFQLPR